MEYKDNKDNFGIIAAIIGVVIYIITIILFVIPLPKKTDTFFVASFLHLPAIIGALIYHKVESVDGWNSSRKL